jgi:hypothetical protein
MLAEGKPPGPTPATGWASHTPRIHSRATLGSAQLRHSRMRDISTGEFTTSAIPAITTATIKVAKETVSSESETKPRSAGHDQRARDSRNSRFRDASTSTTEIAKRLPMTEIGRLPLEGPSPQERPSRIPRLLRSCRLPNGPVVGARLKGGANPPLTFSQSNQLAPHATRTIRERAITTAIRPTPQRAPRADAGRCRRRAKIEGCKPVQSPGRLRPAIAAGTWIERSS